MTVLSGTILDIESVYTTIHISNTNQIIYAPSVRVPDYLKYKGKPVLVAYESGEMHIVPRVIQNIKHNEEVDINDDRIWGL